MNGESSSSANSCVRNKHIKLQILSSNYLILHIVGEYFESPILKFQPWPTRAGLSRPHHWLPPPAEFLTKKPFIRFLTLDGINHLLGQEIRNLKFRRSGFHNEQ